MGTYLGYILYVRVPQSSIPIYFSYFLFFYSLIYGNISIDVIYFVSTLHFLFVEQESEGKRTFLGYTRNASALSDVLIKYHQHGTNRVGSCDEFLLWML